MIRQLRARLSFAVLAAPLVLFAFPNEAAAASTGGCHGDHVVVVDQRVDSATGTAMSQLTVALPVTLEPGPYVVTVTTSDDHAGRSEDPQPNEQVVVVLGSTVVGPTPDLADVDDTATATLSANVDVTEPVASATVRHAFSGTSTHNSVTVDCFSITSVSVNASPEGGQGEGETTSSEGGDDAPEAPAQQDAEEQASATEAGGDDESHAASLDDEETPDESDPSPADPGAAPADPAPAGDDPTSNDPEPRPTDPGSTPVPTMPMQPVCVGDHVAEIGERVDNRGARPSSQSASFESEVPPGRYQITVVTFDGYAGRAGGSAQPNEQVIVQFGDSAFGPTPDLADGIDDAVLRTDGEVELLQPVTTFAVSHALSGGPQHNSVGIECVALSALPTPPPPVEFDIDHTCGGAPSIVVALVSPGETASATVVVDGLESSAILPADQPTSVVVPVEPGVRTVVVVIDGFVLFEGAHEVVCPSTPGAGDGDQPGDDPPTGDGDQPGDQPGDDPSTGDGDQPGDDPSTGDGDQPGDVPPADGDSPGSGDPTDPGGSGDPGTPDDPISGPPVVVTPLGFIPELAVSVQCGGQTIEALVANAGDEAGEVTLAVARGARAAVARLGVGETTVVSLPLPDGAEGTRTDVVLVAPDGTVLNRTVDIDCLAPAAPVATVAVDCAAGTVAITIENTGGERLAVRAFAEQVALLGSDELDGGERAVYETEILGAVVPVRVVTADGGDILRTEVEHGCTERDVEVGVSLACPAGEVELRLANRTADERVVTVESGANSISVDVPAGVDVVLVRSLQSVPDLLVRSRFGDVLLDRSFASSACEPSDAEDEDPVPQGCDTPADESDEWVVIEDDVVLVCTGLQARLVLDCISGVGVVELGNGTERSAAITVRADGTVVAVPEVAVDELASVVVADAAGMRITAEAATDRLLDTSADCLVDIDRTAAVVAGLLVALLSIVAAVAARFDPWIRV